MPEVRAQRVNDRQVDGQGRRQRFMSRILTTYTGWSPKVAEGLSVLYHYGLSMGDVRPALGALLGADAAGLSAARIARLTASYAQDSARFRFRRHQDRGHVYVCADRVHFGIRSTTPEDVISSCAPIHNS